MNAVGLPVAAPASAHRISGIEVSQHRLALEPPFHASWDTQPRVHFDATIVRVRTDSGLVGLGSGDLMLGFAGHEHLFIGQDPLALERHYRVIANLDFHYGRCWPLDLALWDLAGKAANMPIHKLMGSYRSSVPAYASSPVLPSAQAYADEAVSFRERGWTAYKIHPPTRWQDDIKICEAVRKAVGDEYRLMLDSTWSYRYPEALRVGQAIERLGYYWYEDPLVEDDVTNYVKQRQKLSVPILATEYAPGSHTAYAPWLLLQATDYLRGDVAVKGGLTPCLKTAHLAECFHMNYEVHHGGNSLNNVANLHLIMAVKNCEYFEVLLPDGAQKYGLVEDIEVDRDGLVHALSAPGLGARIDFDLIARKQIAVLS